MHSRVYIKHTRVYMKHNSPDVFQWFSNTLASAYKPLASVYKTQFTDVLQWFPFSTIQSRTLCGAGFFPTGWGESERGGWTRNPPPNLAKHNKFREALPGDYGKQGIQWKPWRPLEPYVFISPGGRYKNLTQHSPHTRVTTRLPKSPETYDASISFTRFPFLFMISLSCLFWIR